jgi:hypothetical protein
MPVELQLLVWAAILALIQMLSRSRAHNRR